MGKRESKKRHTRRYSEETCWLIVELYVDGLSKQEIAKGLCDEHGTVSLAKVKRVLECFKATGVPQQDIIGHRESVLDEADMAIICRARDEDCTLYVREIIDRMIEMRPDRWDTATLRPDTVLRVMLRYKMQH